MDMLHFYIWNAKSWQAAPVYTGKLLKHYVVALRMASVVKESVTSDLSGYIGSAAFMTFNPVTLKMSSIESALIIFLGSA